jgi:hypothetical protein
MPTFIAMSGAVSHAYRQVGDKVLGPLQPLPANVGEFELNGMDPKQWFADHKPGWQIFDANLEGGHYHPRIWRGTKEEFQTLPPLQFTTALNAFYSGLQQTEILMADLEKLFTVVQPVSSNLKAYGSEIRNLLILACTEVEAQWRAILEANCVFPGINPTTNKPRKGFTTNDYVKLLAPMKLNEYSYRLARFPNFTRIRPFEKWQASNPTGSLDWYDAYNAVKHDREGQFERATLGHAISAVAAVDVLMAAQFGLLVPNTIGAKSSFATEHVPFWHSKECYYWPPPGKMWTPEPCSM